MDYTMQDHAMRYHMGRKARLELIAAYPLAAWPAFPMRHDLYLEGPLMEDSSWYRLDSRAHNGHWGVD